MKIHINSLKVYAIIGLLDFEREMEQQIVVDLEASYEYDGQNFIDYAKLTQMITDQIKQKRYRLLEDALLDIKEQIVAAYPVIKVLKLKIAKPDIIKNCTVALSNSWSM